MAQLIKIKNRHKLSVRELSLSPDEQMSLRIMQHSITKAFPNRTDRVNYLDNLIEALDKEIEYGNN